MIIHNKNVCFNCMSLSDGDTCPTCGENISVSGNKQPFEGSILLGSILQGRFLVGQIKKSDGFTRKYIGLDMANDTKVQITELFPWDLVQRSDDGISTIVKKEEQFSRTRGRVAEKARLFESAGYDLIEDLVAVFDEKNTYYLVSRFSDNALPLDTTFGKFGFAMDLTICTSIANGLLQMSGSEPSQNYCYMLLENGTIEDENVKMEMSWPEHTRHAPQEVYSSPYVALEITTSDPRGSYTDVYSVCAMLFQTFTGQTLKAAGMRSTSEKPNYISSALKGSKCPQELAEQIIAGLDLDYKKRPQNLQRICTLLANRDAIIAACASRTKARKKNKEKTRVKKERSDSSTPSTIGRFLPLGIAVLAAILVLVGLNKMLTIADQHNAQKVEVSENQTEEPVTTSPTAQVTTAAAIATETPVATIKPTPEQTATPKPTPKRTKKPKATKKPKKKKTTKTPAPVYTKAPAKAPSKPKKTKKPSMHVVPGGDGDVTWIK